MAIAHRTLGLLLPAYVTDAGAFIGGVREALNMIDGWSLELLRYTYIGSGLGELVRVDGWDAAIIGPLQDREAGYCLPLLEKLDLPMVSLGSQGDAQFARVLPDYAACGGMAAQHLTERGYRRLVFLAAGDQAQSDDVWAGFEVAAHEYGGVAIRFDQGPRTRALKRWRLNDQLADFADLLIESDQPTGVLGVDGTHGERALRAADLAGRRVPEQVGVVAIESDDLFCQCCRPSLSGVLIDHQRIAAEATRRVIDGIAPGTTVTVPPTAIVTRQSTDHTATNDPDVAAAIRFIRDHIDQRVTTEDLAAAMNLSRSTLIRRFNDTLGHSPADEIRRLRIAHVQDLLLRTAWPLARIAVTAGFGTVSQLANAFRRATGMTPTQFRRAGR